ncbi:MAG: PHP domain-containing protein [Candidatus Hydrogenedentes bacterium]|nr:PHP domain-containing protein [Candidatus Hydrogenedentota bacterium]
MGIILDIHLHTSRHSRCSRIRPEDLIDQAVRVGLDGLVITEHHYQWDQQELADLAAASRHPGFILLSAFEYSSSQGDLLVYGLEPQLAGEFRPGWPPERAAELVQHHGGVCIAAHPTRADLGFDERLATLPLVAMEVRSVKMKEHEQRLALNISEAMKIPAVAGSDAHDLHDVGRFATEFEDLITCSADLQSALSRGRFHVVSSTVRKAP